MNRFAAPLALLLSGAGCCFIVEVDTKAAGSTAAGSSGGLGSTTGASGTSGTSGGTNGPCDPYTLGGCPDFQLCSYPVQSCGDGSSIPLTGHCAPICGLAGNAPCGAACQSDDDCAEAFVCDAGACVSNPWDGGPMPCAPGCVNVYGRHGGAPQCLCAQCPSDAGGITCPADCNPSCCPAEDTCCAGSLTTCWPADLDGCP